MRIEVLLIIDVKHAPPRPLATLVRAMERRGWVSGPRGRFRIALETECGDEQIVQYVERDVREAEYIAGLKHLDSVCLLNSPDDDADFDATDLQSTGSDVNLL